MLESLFYDLVAEITPLLVTLPDKPEEDGEATVRQLGEHDQQDLKQLQPQTCLRRGFGR